MKTIKPKPQLKPLIQDAFPKRSVDGPDIEGTLEELGKRMHLLFVNEVSRSTLSLYGAVVQEFTEDTVSRYTMTRLGRLVTYFNTLKESLPDGDPGEILIKVPRATGAPEEKKFASCSRRDMNKAIKLLGGEPPQMPTPDTHQVETYHDALRAGVGHVSKVELKASYTESDGTMVTLANIKLTEFKEVVAILAEALRTQGEPEQGQAPRMLRRPKR